jgi:DNA-binding NtrC family response regulator
VSEASRAEEGLEQTPINRTDELIGLLSSRVVGQAHALEHILPDGDGVDFAVSILKKYPDAPAVVMSGTALDEEEILICQRYDIPFLQKLFVAEELLGSLGAISLNIGSIRSAAG